MHHKRLYRRRKSESSSNSALRAWQRQVARLWQQVPEGVAESAAFGVVVIIGIVMIRQAGPHNLTPGIAVCSLGSAGLGWQAWRWRERVMEERRRREKLEMKSERRKMRRQREAEELEDKRVRAAKDAAAHEHAKELQEERRSAEVRNATALEKARRGREEAIEREAMRLITLNEHSLYLAAEEAFQARGYAVVPVGDEANCDLILNGEDGGLLAVARLVPRARQADASDVRALDAWREHIGASAGYLVGLAGFTQSAVRVASETPTTLVEAHLLAQWLFESSRRGPDSRDILAEYQPTPSASSKGAACGE